jgi:predicted dehydrogenase
LTTEDQVGVSGVLEGGAAFSIHYRGGVSRGTNLLWEIDGSEGDLQLTAAGGQAQMFEMTVHGGQGAQSSLEVLPVPELYRWSPPQGPGPSTNVAQAYARFARDYREGTHLCPTFDDAVTRHRMLNGIETLRQPVNVKRSVDPGEVLDRELRSVAVTVGEYLKWRRGFLNLVTRPRCSARVT